MLPESAKRRSNVSKSKFKSMGNHDAFLARIQKSLYYGQLPSTERLSLPVTELATELFSAAQRKRSLQRLELQEASDVSRSACVSPCSLVLALLYLERLQSCRPSYLRDTPPSELYLVSLMVATKFLQDDGEEDGVVNEEWATSAGISTGQLNHLERDFLDAIDWEVFVSEEAFWTRLRGVEREVALNEGARRGWFSYTDLDVLLESVDLASLAHTVLTVSAVCLTSYTASVLTLIASTLLVSQLQPLVGNLAASNEMGLRLNNMLPAPAPPSPSDLLSPVELPDSPTTHSPVDVFTTTFILASISSCGETYGNASTNCNGRLESRMELDEHGIMNLWLGSLNNLQPLLGFSDTWRQSGLSTWLAWVKYVSGWLRSRMPKSGQPGIAPDWATSLCHSIDRNPSAAQTRLFPVQVY